MWHMTLFNPGMWRDTLGKNKKVNDNVTRETHF